jgi:hypothetical protein
MSGQPQKFPHPSFWLLKISLLERIRNSTVGIATGHWTEDRRVGVLPPSADVKKISIYTSSPPQVFLE